MARHELSYDGWGHVSGRHACELRLTWERKGTYLGAVAAVVSGQALHSHRGEGGTNQRFKQALASWMVEELRREIERGRERTEHVDDLYVLGVDLLAVEHLAASNAELPELVEGEVVGRFDV